ncbi:LAMI_0G07756g1_1 [Lachancea mirantina]|uniref:Cell division control protein n=1 Tax=Lachancea mirantina TaxID=1230905 RepID=A0A1G4K9Q4_9SACH|nr:LAMI_0G07756g1_1 [Lachancea mirantina]
MCNMLKDRPLNTVGTVTKRRCSVAGSEPMSKKRLLNCDATMPATPPATPPASPAKMPMDPVKTQVREPVTALRGKGQRLVFGRDATVSRTKAALQRCSDLETHQEACLPTRQSQYDEVMRFLQDTVESRHGNSLYVTGPPGTGKTAQLDLIFREKFHAIPLTQRHQQHPDSNLRNTAFFEVSKGQYAPVAVVSINCIALSNAESIFAKICQSFSDSSCDSVRSADQLSQFMQRYPNTTFIVVLDELDKLVTSKAQDASATKIIFDLFLLAKRRDTRLALVGIANSLDMKDRFLARLNLQQELLPKTVVFAPYTADEMYEIVMHKVSTIGEQPLFQPVAIKFAAKKCSGNTGDLRRLFDVLRSSVELLELDCIKTNRQNSEYDDGTVASPPKVTLAHVAKVFSTVMNSTSTKARLARLNMQQRLVLCSLVHREKYDIFETQCSLDDAYSYYAKLLQQRDSISPLQRNEFLEICSALESCGVVTMASGRSSGKTKQVVKLIKSNVDEMEFSSEIGKQTLLKNLI